MPRRRSLSSEPGSESPPLLTPAVPPRDHLLLRDTLTHLWPQPGRRLLSPRQVPAILLGLSWSLKGPAAVGLGSVSSLSSAPGPEPLCHCAHASCPARPWALGGRAGFSSHMPPSLASHRVCLILVEGIPNLPSSAGHSCPHNCAEDSSVGTRSERSLLHPSSQVSSSDSSCGVSPIAPFALP